MVLSTLSNDISATKTLDEMHIIKKKYHTLSRINTRWVKYESFDNYRLVKHSNWHSFNFDYVVLTLKNALVMAVGGRWGLSRIGGNSV